MSDEDDYNDYNQKPLEERLNYLEEDERSDSFAKEKNYNKKSSKHSKKKRKVKTYMMTKNTMKMIKIE